MMGGSTRGSKNKNDAITSYVAPYLSTLLRVAHANSAAILDTGCAGNNLMADTLCTNIRPASPSIAVLMPIGQ
jgi:hypothetical protein